MFKLLLPSALTLILLSLLTGCVSRDLPLQPIQQNTNPYNVNDVDLSDLDENLTESEMMMTEEGDEKMERIEFPTSEYYSLARTGRGTIKGTIYITDNYGGRVLGSGTRLYLNPITSYSKQWYVESYLGGNRMQKADSRLFNYLKFTAADSKGKFSFYGVPSGSYYLIGTVKCGEECGYESEKSIRIATRVSVQGNQIVNKDLTRTVD
ncbi:hypothetical protein C9925_01185 [cyanobacterium G8-9]|nr:hypothetical protein C9925_01185 [cyanobacterium G8-9]